MIVIGPDNKLYEIKRVTSDTNIVLSEPYTGETQSEVPCRIITTYEGDLTQFSARFTALMSRMSADSKSMRSWLTALDEVTIEREDGTEVTVKPLMQIVNEHNENVEWYKNNTDAIDAAGDKAREAAASAAAAAESANTAGEKASQASQSASAAASSQSAASASATAAKKSETNAEAAKEAAAESASVASTKASEAATSASSASASKDAAKASETNASSSANAAASSATEAANSSKAAKTSETNAKASETAAEQSASSANSSKSAAEASASAASASADSASSSATAAGRSAESASSSATTATTKATEATSQATAAKNSASAAKTSETNAKASEDNAASSKTAAAESASSASASATSASASKDEATKQASAAKGSASTASTKATEAAGSATAASQSKTAAESAATRAEAAADRAEEIAGAVAMEDASLTTKGVVKLSSATDSTSESLAATPKAVKAANDNANSRLAKNQNGADIPGKDTFTKNIGAGRAFGGSVSTTAGNWTTAQFVEWLDSQGAFNHPYWMCKGSWSYGNNKIITDTGCGDIHLAGAVIEVMGIKSAMTIRVTTPTTSSGGGTANAQFTYINHGTDYSPGWRRDYNTKYKPTPSDIGALSTSGGTVSGPLSVTGGLTGSLNGNASTATKLQTARTIGGVAFDGSANINLPGVNTAGNQSTTGNAATATKLQTARTIGGVSFNGTANIDLPGVNKAGNQSTTGNAATATKLQTARTIGGVSFDGTANINLPGVNAAGNQNTTGNAATATKLQTARTINGVSFNGSANISIPTITSRGRVTALTGTTQGAATGLQMYEAYNNGYPSTYGNVLHLKGATAVGEGELFIGWSGTSGAHAPVHVRSRRDTDTSSWSEWAQVYTSKDSIPGVNATGNQNTTGNAATATKLQTARTIGGVSFNGTANINLPGVNIAGNQNTTGNAASATKLQTARTIGGVSFNGTANINLPGVNTTGNQNTTGNAATATKLQTARKIAGVAFDGSADITLTAANLNAYTKTEVTNLLSSYASRSSLTGYSGNLDIISETLVVKSGGSGGFAIWDIGTTTSGANMYIDPNPGINTVWRSTSSRRYKKDIETLQDRYADELLSLRPVWYRSICRGDRKDWGYYGLIAEEVGEIAPQYVHWREPTNNDSPEDISSNGMVAEGVMYERLVVPLIHHIQQLTKRVEELETKLNSPKE
ncbi:tail fiber domain-containing protein (plasmid) [Escherichia albertii]|nr:tail fiber domain-containing protein [Escherichia albertii]WDC27793.1 tail fiber domain-containing protein [Escherichia albertii]